MASVFFVGEYDTYNPALNGNSSQDDSTFVYNKVRYGYTSLMNKTPETFIINNGNRKDRDIKIMMQNNDTLAIKKVMSDYLAIVKEHHLESNISAAKWFALIYHFPGFTDFELIGGKTEPDEVFNSDGSQGMAELTYKYHLPQKVLVNNYMSLSEHWSDPIIPQESLYLLLYFSLALSLAFFAFKATNLRSWLIAVIGMGSLWIGVGIIATISRRYGEYVFYLYWLALILAFAIHFAIKLRQNKDKGFTGITLNLLLWSVGGFLPLIYGLLMKCYDDMTVVPQGDGTSRVFNTPQYEWLEAHLSLFAYLNILAVIIAMAFMTLQIRKWKALAEN
jgi:hypothetical protein